VTDALCATSCQEKKKVRIWESGEENFPSVAKKPKLKKKKKFGVFLRDVFAPLVSDVGVARTVFSSLCLEKHLEHEIVEGLNV
jgi:hypothetical protein